MLALLKFLATTSIVPFAAWAVVVVVTVASAVVVSAVVVVVVLVVVVVVVVVEVVLTLAGNEKTPLRALARSSPSTSITAFLIFFCVNFFFRIAIRFSAPLPFDAFSFGQVILPQLLCCHACGVEGSCDTL